MEAHDRWSPSGYSEEWWSIPPLVKRVSTKSNSPSCSCVGKVVGGVWCSVDEDVGTCGGEDQG